jgi:DNA-binding CsgD family transcriptional regulator
MTIPFIRNEPPVNATTARSPERPRITPSAAAAFLLDHRRRVMAGSARGEALLRGEDVLRLDALGRLHAARSADDGPLQAAIAKAEAAQSLPQSPVCLLAYGSGRAWLAWAEPCEAVASGGCLNVPRIEAQQPTATVLLFVTPAEPGASVQARATMAQFGLSAAESRLVSALLAGHTLEGYARETGLSRNTARNQLAVVFEKTGTHRQLELVALIAGGQA